MALGLLHLRGLGGGGDRHLCCCSCHMHTGQAVPPASTVECHPLALRSQWVVSHRAAAVHGTSSVTNHHPHKDARKMVAGVMPVIAPSNRVDAVSLTLAMGHKRVVLGSRFRPASDASAAARAALHTCHAIMGPRQAGRRSVSA